MSETTEQTETKEQLLTNMLLGILDDPEGFPLHMAGGVCYRHHPEMGHQQKRAITLKNVMDYCEATFGRRYRTSPEYVPETDILARLEKEAKALFQDNVEKASGGFKAFNTIMEFVQNEMKVWGYADQEDGTLRQILSSGGEHPAAVNDFIAHCRIAVDNYNSTIPKVDNRAIAPVLKVDLIPSVLETIRRTVTVNRAEEWREKHKFLNTGEEEEDLTNVVKGLFAVYHIKATPGNIAAFKHMLWSIKRKAFMKNIPLPLFYSFQSNQGGMGKSELTRRISPAPWMYNGTITLDNVGNPKELQSAIRGVHLVNFDELAIDDQHKGQGGAMTPGKLAAFKNMITCNIIACRGLYTHQKLAEWQSAVWVSTAQWHIYDLVQEGINGMRRFWEFKMEPPHTWDKSDDTEQPDDAHGNKVWPNSEHYKNANKYLDRRDEIYQMIDENDEEGYYHPGKPEYSEMINTQNSYAHADAFSLYMEGEDLEFAWIEDRYPNPDDPKAVNISIICKSAERVVKEFNAWRVKQGNNPWSPSFILAQINSIHHAEGDKDPVAGKGKFYYFRSTKDASSVPQRSRLCL